MWILVVGLALLGGCNNAKKVEIDSWEPPKGSTLPLLTEGIKITTWNLQWFPGKQKEAPPLEEEKAHVNSVKSVLKEINPEILCLQEIKGPDDDPDKFRPLLDDIAKELGGSVTVMSEFKRDLEVAIISRHPAQDKDWQEFKEADPTPSRGFAYAAFKVNNQILLVYTVHLKSNYGGIDTTAPLREESARQLIAHADEKQTHFKEQGLSSTVMLCGDFNYDPGSAKWKDDKTFAILREKGFQWAGLGLDRKETISWLTNGRYPDAAFDHFLFRASPEMTVSRSITTKTDRSVSDHRAVSILVNIQGQ